MSGTTPGISHAFIPEKAIVTTPFYEMRKVRHTANEWAKGHLDPGLRMEPVLLMTCVMKIKLQEARPKLSNTLRKLKW